MRLEQRGFVRGKWGVTENNRKARFYSITAAGRRQLAAERAEWDQVTSIMTPYSAASHDSPKASNGHTARMDCPGPWHVSREARR